MPNDLNPIGTGIGFIKWFVKLSLQEKMWAFSLLIIIFSVTINIYQFSDNATLQKENLSYAKICEEKAAKLAIATTINERNRADSVLATERIKYELLLQKIFMTRTPEIKERNEKIKQLIRK